MITVLLPTGQVAINDSGIVKATHELVTAKALADAYIAYKECKGHRLWRIRAALRAELDNSLARYTEALAKQGG